MKERLMEFVSELWEQQQRVESGEADSESVSVCGSEIRVEHLETGAVRYSTPDEVGFDGTTWLPSPTRPDGYPTEIPFFPNLRTSITEFGEQGRAMVSWPKTGDPKALVLEVARELESLGWTRRGERGLLFGILGREVEFERRGSRSKVSVFQFPGRDASVKLIVDHVVLSGSDDAQCA